MDNIKLICRQEECDEDGTFIIYQDDMSPSTDMRDIITRLSKDTTKSLEELSNFLSKLGK